MKHAVAMLGALGILAGICGGEWGLAGCSKSPARPAVEKSTVPARSYRVRGVIDALPRAGKPGTQLMIHHREIPDFVARDGRTGMKEMSMPFPVGPGVQLEGLRIGDAVEFEFTVDWNAEPSYWVTVISRSRSGEQGAEPTGPGPASPDPKPQTAR